MDIDPRNPLFWEDIIPRQSWRTAECEIRADDIVEFARQFDPMPMHLGPETARGTALGVFCASGIHTLGITQKLLCERLFLNTALIAGGKISNFVMRRPVLPGDVLTVTISAREKRENARRPDAGWVDFAIETSRADGHAVLEYESSILFKKKEPAG